MGQALRIDFVADVVCPFCWIGWARLKRALAGRPALDPDIVWRPFQLAPDLPPEGMDRKTYLEAKFAPGVLADMQARILDMGKGDGLEFRFGAIERSPNTSRAHRVILWAAAEGQLDAAADAMFAAYFRDGRDIGDAKVLAQIAHEAGLDAGEILRRLAADLDAELIRAAHIGAVRAGVAGVPFYVFGERIGLSGAQEPAALISALDRAATLARPVAANG